MKYYQIIRFAHIQQSYLKKKKNNKKRTELRVI